MTALTRIEMVVYLQAVDLFGHCTAEQMVRIASIARQRQFAAGEAIYHANGPSEALYCVVEGTVVLSGDGPTRRIGAPGTFGVEEILSDRLRAENAHAEQPTMALVVDADDFFDLLSNNIEIVKALFRQLLQRPANREAEPRPSPPPSGVKLEVDPARPPS